MKSTALAVLSLLFVVANAQQSNANLDKIHKSVQPSSDQHFKV